MALYPLNFLIALLFFFRHDAAFFHFSLPYPDSCRWILAAAALMRKRYFITEHLVPPDPFKAGAYFAVTHLLFNVLKRLSYERALRVIAVSDGNREILVRKYGMPREKMIVIHNGVDCSKYAADARGAEQLRKKLGIPGGSLVLTCIGRLAEQKGQKYLVAALDILAKAGYPLFLLLVGEGPLKTMLEEDAGNRGVAGQVRFAGFRRDIPAIFDVTDIFVLPSLNEGFPLTLLEAMAAGKPVVATRVTGNAEAIVDGETGLLCAPASAEELAGKILTLIKDPQERAALGGRARDAALRGFDVAIMIDRTRALYEKGAACAGQ
jgi:glycosyltransferase involved in cell wall biosynthesis